MKVPVDPAVLRDLLDYDPATGVLTWKPRALEWFPDTRACKVWNTKNAGSAVGYVMQTGYILVSIQKKRYLAHRIAWAWVHGHWPVGEIDHGNGVRTDNRLTNLRDVSRLENRKNQKLPQNNKSGVIGVHFHKALGKWTSEISTGNCRTYLGVYLSFEDAVAARKAAELKHGFHQNHGRAT